MLLQAHAPGTSADVQIVIPAFNEERRIGATLTTLLTYLDSQSWTSSVVVIDNGSSDRTSEVVDRVIGGASPVTVLGCASQGKGAAVRRGMLHGTTRWVGFCDADGSTPFDSIGRAIEQLEQGSDVVVGSRRVAGASYQAAQPMERRVAGAVFRRLVRPIVPAIADTQCGFKFFTRSAASEIFERTSIDGFAFDVEVLALAHRLGHSVAELPVDWSDVDGSTLRISSHGKHLLRDIRQLRSTFSGEVSTVV